MATTTEANNIRGEAQLHPIPSSITTTTTTTTTATTSIHPGDYDLVVKEATPRPSSSADLWKRLRGEAQQVLEAEPELQFLFQATILEDVQSFEDAIAKTVAYRLLQGGGSSGTLSVCDPLDLYSMFRSILRDHANICRQIQADVLAVVDRDPACDTLLEVILFMKGFAALVTHRIAHAKWTSTSRSHCQKNKSYLALWLQSQASVMFGVDIHPGAQLGSGILLDHGTGIVIGETAVVGDNCTLLHGVTLGGTGKDHGDRHPKIGQNVLIGAGTQVLGNIQIGNCAKIGAGSVVLRPIPPGATAVGAPAKIIGRALDANPAQNPDSNLDHVGLLHKSVSDGTLTTTTAATTDSSGSGTSQDEDDDVEEEAEVASSREQVDDVLSSDGKDKILLQSKESKERRHSSSIVLTKTKSNAKKKKNHVDRSPPPGCVCPYREYTRMALTAPPHAITILNLAQVFMSVDPQATTTDQVGCTFFELDLENVGHVYWPKDDNTNTPNADDGDDEANASLRFEKRLVKALQNNTSLTSEHQQQIIEKLRRRFAGKTSTPNGGTTASGS